MDPKRQREIALGTTAVLLVAIAVWVMQGSSTATRRRNVRTGDSGTARLEAARTSRLLKCDLKALEAERPEPEEGTRNPFRFKPKPAATAAAVGGGRAATATGSCRASGTTRRTTAAAAHSAEVHRRHERSEERRQADCDFERRTRRVPTDVREKSSKAGIRYYGSA